MSIHISLTGGEPMEIIEFKSELKTIDTNKSTAQLLEEKAELNDLAFMQEIINASIPSLVKKRKIKELDPENGAKWEVILHMGLSRNPNPEIKAEGGICVKFMVFTRPKILAANLAHFYNDFLAFARFAVPKIQKKFDLEIDHRIYTKRLGSGEQRIIREKYGDDISDIIPILPVHRVETQAFYTIVCKDRMTGESVEVKQIHANENMADTMLRARLLLSQKVMTHSMVENYYGSDDNE